MEQHIEGNVIQYDAPLRDDEIEFIAIVQMAGIVTDNAPVRSKAFAFKDDAILWAREQVEEVGGSFAHVISHFTQINHVWEGNTKRYRQLLWTIVSEETPCWGMVIACNNERVEV